jgi:hypothetical protein
MGEVIDRRAADVEGHPVRVAGRENPFFSIQGVVENQRHREAATFSLLAGPESLLD